MKKIKRPKQFVPPIKRNNGSWARTDEEKAITFAEYLQLVFEPPPRRITLEEEEEILNNIQTSEQEEYPIDKVKNKEVIKIIKSLKTKKSPGYDGIDGKLLKELPQKGIRFITILMNSIIRLRYFPAQWKVAQIILIPKPGKPTVWHEGLLYKLSKIVPKNLYCLLKSYLCNRMFQVKINNEVTELYPIKAGVPQGSVLGPILYVIYTADIPSMKGITLGTYADDTTIIATHKNPTIASLMLQNYLFKLQQWFKTWRIVVNENKSTQVTFTLRKETCPAVYLNNKVIP